ncbi:hypothetical protein [Bradyrhizobium sp.]|uniref:hypothetical protein n=1 Tax=Bradyrhizobium sp. TaxID=376 RepID=UPI003C42A53E
MYSATKNEALKREHGSRFASISEALFKTDPAHLNFETNPDEYESEVVAIIRRLSSAQSAEDVQTILHEELVRTLWDVGVSIDALPSLAAEIWKLWCG